MAEPFRTTPYPNLLADDPTLGSALQTAIAEVESEFPDLRPLRTVYSIAAVDDTVSPFEFSHGGHHYGDTYFSASLLKIAAVYAAYELQNSANALGMVASAPSEMFSLLHETFDHTIAEAVLPIKEAAQAPGVTVDQRRAMLRPDYERIFSPVRSPDGLIDCNFKQSFFTELRQAIVKSDNHAAARCVQALSYSWINGALRASGFFFPPAQSGLWLGGTFVGALPAVRIPSVNDGDTAQAATCFDMANLYAHIFSGSLVDIPSSADMRNMLFDTGAFNNLSFLALGRNFWVTHSKIGVASLKNSNRNVASEGAFIHDKASLRKFVVVFQNSFDDVDSLRANATVVERTIERFLRP